MNSKNSILLIDPDFDPNTARECVLLVRITPDSFSYAIIDKGSDQLKAVFDHQECNDPIKEMAQKIQSDTYLKLRYLSIKASVYTENTLSIPNEMFSIDDLDHYAQYFSGIQPELYVQPFADYGFTSVFNFSQLAEETLQGLASSKRYDHSAPMLAMARHNDPDSLLLDFTAASFHATYIANGQLVFQKYYQTDNTEEFNYYLLLMVSQLEVDTSNTMIYLSGIIHQDDSKYNCISKYFKSIRFSAPKSKGTDHRILDDMPLHYYSSLLALDQCV